MLTSMRIARHRSAPVAPAALTLALLAACGGNSTAGGPQVASVPTTSTRSTVTSGSTPDASSSASVVDRQLRVGATQAEVDRAYAAYYACWSAAGVPSTTAGGRDGGPLLTMKLHPKKYQSQIDSCADKEPLNPPEESAATNPKYWDDLRAELKCDTAKGLHLKITPGQEGLWADPGTQANFEKLRTPASVQIQRDCEVQAYTQK
jgi:hypothetical protein